MRDFDLFSKIQIWTGLCECLSEITDDAFRCKILLRYQALCPQHVERRKLHQKGQIAVTPSKTNRTLCRRSLSSLSITQTAADRTYVAKMTTAEAMSVILLNQWQIARSHELKKSNLQLENDIELFKQIYKLLICTAKGSMTGDYDNILQIVSSRLTIIQKLSVFSLRELEWAKFFCNTHRMDLTHPKHQEIFRMLESIRPGSASDLNVDVLIESLCNAP